MRRQVSIAEGRSRFARLVHDVESGETVEVTRRGKAVAILLSVGEYAQLSGERGDLWAAIQRWRDSVDFSEWEDTDDPWADVRDPSPGRASEL